MYKNIIFDYYGVIGYNSKILFNFLSFLLKPSIYLLKSKISIHINEYSKGKLSIEEFWLKSEKSLGFKIPKYIKRKIIDLDNSSTFVPKEIIDRLEKIKKKGIQIILLSDVIKEYKDNNIKKGNYSYFDKVYLSCDMGLSKRESVRKKDTTIFQTVIDELDINPKDSIFVDDKKSNCNLAEKVGLNVFRNKNSKSLIKFFDNSIL